MVKIPDFLNIGPWLRRRAERREQAKAIRLAKRLAADARPPLLNYGHLVQAKAKTKRRIYAAAVVFCFFYGAAFTLLAPFMVLPLLLPIVVLAALVIWALPESPHPPLRGIELLVVPYLAVLVIWPNYLAIAVPGLPWITVSRLILVPLLLIFFISLSVSAQLRDTLRAMSRDATPVMTLALCLMGLQALSIALASNKGGAISVFINIGSSEIAALFCGLYAFRTEERRLAFARMLCWTGAYLCLLGLLEYKLGKVVWQGHIPSFLKVQDQNVNRFLEGTTRGAHRVQGTFTTSLGMSEYLGAIVFPFLVYLARRGKYFITKAPLLLMVPILVLVVVFTQARVGLIGICVTVFTFPFIELVTRWRRNPNDVWAAAGIFASPFAALSAVGVGLLIPGIRLRVLGGGVAQLSTQARHVQWTMGIPKIISHPWGYGIGEGATTLGYFTAGGIFTIDSYTLRLLLEYGILGAGIYYALFCIVLYKLGQIILDLKGDEERRKIAIPLFTSLLAYLLIKSVYAQEDNQPQAFCMIALACALLYNPSKTSVKADAA